MRFLASMIGAVLVMLSGSAEAQTYTQISTTTTTVGAYTRTEVVVQPGLLPVDRFTMYRVRLTTPSTPAKGSVLLMSPFGPGFIGGYESHETSTYSETLTGRLVSAGYEVFGYSSRGQFLPAGYCGPLAVDCSAMKDWGIATHAADAHYIRQWISTLHPSHKVVIGGYSLGSMTSMVAAGTYPSDWEGAIIWEGSLYTTDTAARATAQKWCSSTTVQMTAGSYYDDASGNGFKTMSSQAEGDPSGPFHVALVGFFSNPPPIAPPTNPVPGYIFAAGNPATNSFDFADDRRIYRSFEHFGNYAPNRISQDVTCSIAGDRTLTSNFSLFTKPLYVIAGGRGFGAYMSENIALFGSTDVTWNYDSRYGHFDHFLHASHYTVTEQPIINWLNTKISW